MYNAFEILNVPQQAALAKQTLMDAYAHKRKEATTDEACADINAAFKLLSDPIARAELVISLKKVTIDAHEDLPAGELMAFFERQESLDIIPDAQLLERVQELRTELFNELCAIDAADTPEAMKTGVLRARYTHRLVTSLTRRLDATL